MSNNDNVVKIGTAIKWRNTFDLTKKYYQENVVTACGCVFRCKVLQVQGKSPIKMTDDQGHIVYTNTDVWDVLVDMAYYYNYAVDTRKLTQQMLDYAKKLDEAFQKQQKEIEAIQKDNKDQWGHINAIEKVNDEQQRELNAVFDTISCFSEGIWIDTLLWSNETIWVNNKYAITDDLQNQINELTETHRQDIEDLTEKHNSEISKLAAHVVQREKYQNDINDYLQEQVYELNNTLSCFGSGVWENDLHWSQHTLWDNNKYAKTDALSNNLEELSHHIKKHEDDIKELQDIVNEHDQQIIDFIDTLSCFSSGQWDNEFKWSSKALWEDSNFLIETLDDIRAYNGCFEKGEWASPFFWNNTDVWYNSPNIISEIETDIINHNTRLSALESQFELFLQQFTAQQTIIEQQQDILETFTDCFTVLNLGRWHNLLFWDNSSKWSDVMITEAAADGGIASVAVKSYDPETKTVSI